jgi:hypothetical protein
MVHNPDKILIESGPEFLVSYINLSFLYKLPLLQYSETELLNLLCSLLNSTGA